ncbi:hypothetical protein KGF54_004114 [Candida jiufengensis]|uniref:uncharacterized protein n=1 Tax=Candida jiufengensis TaxID=497108 RepID=UPI002224498D|nr:uncharacterized protein KGF54_004114 [Candida jiufengensis]KAI5951040.1 hypothetical protein KGF54_004114 [Candida jiufengensis]
MINSQTMKHFPTGSILLLGPLFVITTDFVFTRFSQTGGAKKLAKTTGNSSPSAKFTSSYNPHAYRSSWVQQWEDSKN